MNEFCGLAESRNDLPLLLSLRDWVDTLRNLLTSGEGRIARVF